MGLNTIDYEKICLTPFEKKGDFMDPEQFRIDIYKMFLEEHGLMPPELMKK